MKVKVIVLLGKKIEFGKNLQKEQARKPRSYASLKLRLTDSLTHKGKVKSYYTTGFYMAKLDEIGYQVCFSSCRDMYV